MAHTEGTRSPFDTKEARRRGQQIIGEPPAGQLRPVLHCLHLRVSGLAPCGGDVGASRLAWYPRAWPAVLTPHAHQTHALACDLHSHAADLGVVMARLPFRPDAFCVVWLGSCAPSWLQLGDSAAQSVWMQLH